MAVDLVREGKIVSSGFAVPVCLPGPVTLCLLLSAAAIPLATSGATAGDVSAPSMVANGPYGDPFLLLPNPSGSPRLPLVRVESGTSSRPASRASRSVSPSAGGGAATSAGDLDDDDDEDAPTRPGRLPTTFPKLPDPNPLAKRRSLGPHLSPDLSYDATERASFGVIGNSGRLDGRTTSSFALPAASTRLGTGTVGSRAAAAPGSATKSRDLGLGLSFQYRFGQ